MLFRSFVFFHFSGCKNTKRQINKTRKSLFILYLNGDLITAPFVLRTFPPKWHSRQAKNIISYLSAINEIRPPRPGETGTPLLKKGGETEASCGSEEPPCLPNCHCPKFLLLDRRSTRGTKGRWLIV